MLRPTNSDIYFFNFDKRRNHENGRAAIKPQIFRPKPDIPTGMADTHTPKAMPQLSKHEMNRLFHSVCIGKISVLLHRQNATRNILIPFKMYINHPYS